MKLIPIVRPTNILIAGVAAVEGLAALGTMIGLALALTAVIVPHVVPGIADGRNDVVTKGLLYLGLATTSAVLWMIANRLRHILRTARATDPFQFDNVGRLQDIAYGLTTVELLSILTARYRPEVLLLPAPTFQINGLAWLAIVVILFLAEIFRHGARMRDDAAWTV